MNAKRRRECCSGDRDKLKNVQTFPNLSTKQYKKSKSSGKLLVNSSSFTRNQKRPFKDTYSVKYSQSVRKSPSQRNSTKGNTAAVRSTSGQSHQYTVAETQIASARSDGGSK